MKYYPEKKYFEGQRVFDDVFDTKFIFREQVCFESHCPKLLSMLMFVRG